MIRAIHPFLVVLILLSLAVAGGVPRAIALGGTEMVICNGDGEATIWLDADGNPTDAPLPCGHCPDCIVLVAANLPDPVSVPEPVGRSFSLWRQASDCPAPASHWPATLPRGPPADAKTGMMT